MQVFIHKDEQEDEENKQRSICIVEGYHQQEGEGNEGWQNR